MAAAQGKARREAPPAQEPRARRKEAHKAQQSALSMAELGKGGPKERRVFFSVDTAGTPSGAASAEVSSGSVLPIFPALPTPVSSVATPSAAKMPCDDVHHPANAYLGHLCHG